MCSHQLVMSMHQTRGGRGSGLSPEAVSLEGVAKNPPGARHPPSTRDVENPRHGLNASHVNRWPVWPSMRKLPF